MWLCVDHSPWCVRMLVIVLGVSGMCTPQSLKVWLFSVFGQGCVWWSSQRWDKNCSSVCWWRILMFWTVCWLQRFKKVVSIITAQWSGLRLTFWLELWVWQRQAIISFGNGYKYGPRSLHLVAMQLAYLTVAQLVMMPSIVLLLKSAIGFCGCWACLSVLRENSLWWDFLTSCEVLEIHVSCLYTLTPRN